MGRSALWTSIANTLRSEIGSGHYNPGDKLPTEAELSARSGVNRHTLRRALKDLTDQGLLYTRRGAGVFVATKPTEYPLGKRVRFTQNLQAAGHVPGRKILLSESRKADMNEAKALQIAPHDPVHVMESLSYADDLPIILARSVFPLANMPDLPQALANTPSVTEALRLCGVADYTRASTRITAKLASATQALHLQIQEGGPILRTTSINIDPECHPVEFGTAWFAGDRMTLTFENPI
jgi:GntR family phosphonate transport system transcriptional regulator